jgi:hypothetical protein
VVGGGSIHRVCVGPRGGVGRWSPLVVTSITKETTKNFNAESLKGSNRSPVMSIFLLELPNALLISPLIVTSPSYSLLSQLCSYKCLNFLCLKKSLFSYDFRSNRHSRCAL